MKHDYAKSHQIGICVTFDINVIPSLAIRLFIFNSH